MKPHHVLLLLAGMVLGATSASAQDKGRIGMAMGYPGSIAAIWHLTEAIAIRPEVDLWSESREYPYQTTTRTTNALEATVGVSGMFFFATHDDLRTYVSPRVGYTRTTSTIRSSDASVPDVDLTGSEYSAGVSVGAQYAIGRRFSAYGELGFVYEHYRVEGGGSTGYFISTRPSVGVIVYLR
jgi:hypothetical protein